MPHAALAWPLMLAALLLAPGVLAPAPPPAQRRPAQPGTTAAADASPEPERVVKRVRVPVGVRTSIDRDSAASDPPVLAVTTSSSLDFGTVVQGARATVTRSSTDAGKVVVTAERPCGRGNSANSAKLKINVTQPEQLGGASSGVAYRGTIHANKGEDNAQAAEQKGNSFTYAIEPVKRTGPPPHCSDPPEKKVYVYLHGSVDAGGQQPSGSYASDIDVEAVYENDGN